MAEISLIREAPAGTGLAVRHITFRDIESALRHGIADLDTRAPRMFVYLIWPVLGLVLLWAAMERNLIALVFPLVAGFALIGPFLAIGLYEISRQRERGHEISLGRAFNIFRMAAKGTLFTLGAILAVLFFAWLVTAALLYGLTLGPAPPDSLADFADALFGTQAGWTLIVVGNAAGFVFALTALAISAVSFPLILDRNVGLGTAVLTSVDAVVKNPLPMVAWGLIVGGFLFIGALPALIGLAVVFPILGHATWHLYRRVVI